MKNGVCPERELVLMKIFFFKMNEKESLIGKLLTHLQPLFSHLWQQQEVVIRVKRDELLQTKGKAKQNNHHLSQVTTGSA